MNEVVEIKRHNFDAAKNKLKEFSRYTNGNIIIDSVKTDTCFGLLERDVSAKEFNSRMKVIQNHLINIGEINNKTIREFKEIYNALDFLDSEYIASIINNINAIEKTSNDVREQQKILRLHNDKIASHQNEIDDNIENINKVVAILKKFQNKLEEFKHLSEIDKIWSDCVKMRDDIQIVFQNINNLSTKISNELTTSNTKYNQINQLIINLQKESKNNKDLLDENINITSDIENSVSVIQEELKNNNNETSLLKNDIIDSNEKNICQFSKIQKEMDAFKIKLKYAYYIGGVSLGLAVIESIFILTRVI